MAPKLIDLLPPHIHRVHPYAGGLSELFAWPCEGVSEVVNDLNGDLIAFWSVMADETKFAMFHRKCEATPCSEREFKLAKDLIKLHTKSVDRAHALFVLVRQSRQALQKDFATLSRTRTRRGMNELASAWWSAVEGLAEVHERLKRVVILNREAIDVIRQQDGPDTFFYLDPPYLHETRSAKKAYQNEMSREEHALLLMTLAKIEGKFMLSGYPSEMYTDAAELYGWRTRDFDLPNNASGKKSKERKVERVWMNYKL